MTESKDYFGEQLRLAERAREDAYFRKVDRALIEQMRQQDQIEAEAAAQPPPCSPILVPVDFSEYSTAALRYAAHFAERLGASIIVMHVIPSETASSSALPSGAGQPMPFLGFQGSWAASSPPSDTPQEVDEQALINLREHAYTALQAAIPTSLAKHTVELRVVVGQPFARILETAVREHVAMIILGTHGRTGLAHLVMGSVAERIVRLAPCPVLTVKAGTQEEHGWLQKLYETFLTP